MYNRLFPLLIFLFWLQQGRSQPVLIDEAVEAAGLICFPVFGDSMTYKYLPSQGRVALNSENLPEFSFLQYAAEKKATGASAQTIGEAAGGAILHFLVLYDTPEEQVRRAESRLRNKLKRKVQLNGPVMFSKGSYMVISSILQMDGSEKKVVLHTGEAPVFQNSKVAFSFSLDPTQAQLMAESFKMATPDISVMFDLSFSGLTLAYNAVLEVDWSEVQKSTYSNESMDFIFYSKDVEKTFGELRRSGGVKLSTIGNDSTSEALLDLVYEKLLNMMFNPVRPDLIPGQKADGILEDVFGTRGPSVLLGIGGSNVYKKKEVRTSGKTVVNINSRSTVTRHHFVTFNIGDMWKKYGDNNRIFRKVALDDPTYKQRDVYVSIDGSLADEFDKMVNNVSVTLRKNHSGGDQTVREMLLSKKMLETNTGPLAMSYLNKQDTDREKWLDYQYQVSWQFKTDGQYTVPWVSSSTPMINLFTPYRYHEIILDGDWAKLEKEGVKAVSIQIKYDFFGKEKSARQTIRPADAGQEKRFSLILPAGMDGVDYTMTWLIKDGSKKELTGHDKYGVIFYDETPR